MVKNPITAISIDPEDCRDIDDAVFCHTYCSGDVSSVSVYIPNCWRLNPNTQAWNIASELKRTRYFANSRRKTMLPPDMESAHSLSEDEIKDSFEIRLWIDEKGEIVDCEISKSKVWVLNHSYESASTSKDPYVKNQIDILAKVCDKINTNRLRKGITCGVKLPKGRWVGEDLDEQDIQYPTQAIVLILMVSANYVIAKFFKANKVDAIFRYQSISKEKVENDPVLSMLNVTIGESAIALDVRSRDRAYYGATPLPHASLGIDCYCHATSPLRRFSDLLNNKILDCVIDGRTSIFSVGYLENAVVEINEDKEERDDYYAQENYKEKVRNRKKRELEKVMQQKDLNPKELSLFVKIACKGGDEFSENFQFYVSEKLKNLQPKDFFLLLESRDKCDPRFYSKIIDFLCENSEIAISTLTIYDQINSSSLHFTEEALSPIDHLCWTVISGNTVYSPGRGTTKKEAKKQSVSKLIKAFFLESETLVTESDRAKLDFPKSREDKTEKSLTSGAEIINCSEDPVSELNLYTQREGVKKPEYINKGKVGSNWACQCVLGDYVETGIGTTKKEAKKQSAQKIYERILEE
jgi:hypothetical protein